MTKTTKARRDIYQEITDKVVASLVAGTVPWHQPWTTASMPLSMSTNRPYRGINVFILGMTSDAEGYASPYWGTYKQITERGGQVRKGEKSTMIILWRPVEKKDQAGKVVERFMVLRSYNVFNDNQADWAEGSRRRVAAEVHHHDPIVECEDLVAQYLSTGPAVDFGSDQAYYSPRTDHIAVPDRSQCPSIEEYYSVLFHEITHSTGHKDRLNREGITEGHRFGDVVYSKEELVAEMGAAMMSGLTGIDQVTLPNSAAYIANWIKVLDDDPKMVVAAGAAAQRAVDLATSASFEDEKEEEVAA